MLQLSSLPQAPAIAHPGPRPHSYPYTWWDTVTHQIEQEPEGYRELLCGAILPNMRIYSIGF